MGRKTPQAGYVPPASFHDTWFWCLAGTTERRGIYGSNNTLSEKDCNTTKLQILRPKPLPPRRWALHVCTLFLRQVDQLVASTLPMSELLLHRREYEVYRAASVSVYWSV